MMTQPDARAGGEGPAGPNITAVIDWHRNQIVVCGDGDHETVRALEWQAAEIDRLRLQLGWRDGLLVMGEDGVPRPLYPHPTGWLPIATAPRDGTPLMLFARCRTATAPIRVIGWHLDDLGWIEACFAPNEPRGLVPTYWQPLPEFPLPEVMPAPDGWADGSNVR